MATSNARSAADEYVLEHPTLGSMTGVVHTATPDIVQFRGIPYATLPGRFMRSMIRENIDGMSRDFTKPGYACPHTFDMDDIHSGGSYPGQQPIRASELDSLILEVSVPRSHLESQNSKSWERLPVMTYIHGGAFVLGKIDAHHNAAYMAQHSLAIARPVITAAIQYRLGALGFMATPDGGKNLGLWDQRNALTWIQQFINGFGGDKRRVTLFGESAGGYSICCHMLSHQPYSGPLFSRVIIMSGVMGPMLTPISEDKASKAFEDVCHNLGIQERGEAAMDKLRALDVQKLVSANDTWIAKGNMWSPVDDPSFFRTKVTWDNVHEILGSCEGLDGMIVGNTGFEGLAYPSVAYSMTPKSFLEHLKRELSNDAVEKVLKAYNVTLDMDQTLFLTSAMRWCGDIIFDGTSAPHVLLLSIFRLLTLQNQRLYTLSASISRESRRRSCSATYLTSEIRSRMRPFSNNRTIGSTSTSCSAPCSSAFRIDTSRTSATSTRHSGSVSRTEKNLGANSATRTRALLW
jgi:carboxylesterase type B